MEVRDAAVAGQFYSANPEQLSAEVARLLSLHAPPRRAEAKMIVCPHAGYMYSGGVAGQVYASVNPPESAILIGPDHAGLAREFSVFSRGKWRTPLGDVAVDSEVADRVLKSSPLFSDDPGAHARDHCLEVQLPFLQTRNPSVRVVPVLVGTRSSEALREAGHALGEALMDLKPCPLIVVSSDLNHFEPLSISQKKDRRAIRAMLELDEERLMMECESHQITMCGLGPAYTGLVAAKRLGAHKAELIDYRTSADAGAGEDSVVGYAGLVIW